MVKPINENGLAQSYCAALLSLSLVFRSYLTIIPCYVCSVFIFFSIQVGDVYVSAWYSVSFLECGILWVNLSILFYFISSTPDLLFTSDFIIITSLFMCITVFSICLLSFLLLVPYNPLFPAHELLQGPFPYYNLIPSEIPSACCSRIRKFYF